MSAPQPPAVTLYVGGHAWTIAGERYDLGGQRCFTAVHRPPPYTATAGLRFILDSGAYSESPDTQPSLAGALERQLAWEAAAAAVWDTPVMAQALVSRDTLIDELWVDGVRHKRRWSVHDAERAVRETVDAAAYLASRRHALAPRHLVLSCQGVDAGQYRECVAAVCRHARLGDWIGLGGWCWVGRHQTWLPEFQRTVASSLPLIAAAGVRHVHLFGVLWEPAVASLLWQADQHGISVSVDSTAPMLAATRGNARKAGMRGHDWRSNIAWWKAHLAGLRSSRWYKEPYLTRQLQLLEVA